MISEQSLITFYRDDEQDNLYHIEIRDFERSSSDFYAVKRFSYESDIEADEGELVVQENTVYIAPHNKQLNLIDGVWYLNEFKSTTPVITVSNEVVQEVTQDAYLQAYGSIFTVGPPEKTGNIVIQTGTQLTTVPITSDLVYSLNTNTLDELNEKRKNTTKLIFVELLETYGLTPYSSYLDVEKNNEYTINLDGFDCLIKYREEEKTYGIFTNITYGIDFTLTAYGNYNPIYITIESNDTLTGFFTSNIENGQGIFFDPNFEVRNSLDQSKDYYYTARYVYLDGHKSRTCFPVYTKTNNNRRFNVLRITSDLDLNDTFVDIEIFRKTEGGPFYLIDRINNPKPMGTGLIQFVDNGKQNQSLLDERTYIWTASHKTHCIVRDRYVRANLDYDNRDFDISGILSILDKDEGESLPPNVTVDLFARKRFGDGTLSFHKFVNKDSYLFESQVGDNNEPLFVEKELKASGFQNYIDERETALYLRYQPLDTDEGLAFNVTEVISLLNPSLETKDDEFPEFSPNPKLFIGYRYIYKNTNGFFTPSQDGLFESFTPEYPNGDIVSISNTPDIFTIPYKSFIDFGTDEQYRLFYHKVSPTKWELSCFLGLSNVINNSIVNARVIAVGASSFDTSTYQEVLGSEIRVIGLEDYSKRYSQSDGQFGVVVDEIDSRVYVVLESGSPFDTYKKSNTDFRLTEVKISLPYIVGDYFGYQYSGGMLNPSAPTIGEINVFKVINTRPPEISDNSLIYVGKLDGEEVSLRNGFEKKEINNSIYWVLKESNIYEQLVTLDDLDYSQHEFPNQIIWSEPLLLGTQEQGSRNLNFTNVLNIHRDYGQIVKIVGQNNRLLIFCERGVAVAMVGEQLTQTPSNQTFIEGINFINSPVWILKNMEGIQRESIKVYENNVFFSDGKDVYVIDESLQNITQGAVNFGLSEERFFGYPFPLRRKQKVVKLYGAIDPYYKEYRISNGDKTYCYSIESGTWTGPHDYTQTISTVFGYRSVGVVDGELIEHNVGNFRSENADSVEGEYETVIESTSNDMNDAFTTKLFRKFYIETDGQSTFGYSKDSENWTDVDLSTAQTKNGLKHVGINSDNQNSRYLFWRFVTKAQDFVLKLVSFEFTRRDRR